MGLDQVLPNVESFKFKVRIKCQVGKYISTRTKKNKLEMFYKNGQKINFLSNLYMLYFCCV